MAAAPTPWGRDVLPRLLAPWRAGLVGLDRRVRVVVAASFLSVMARMGVGAYLGIYYVQEVHLSIATVGLAFLLGDVVRGLLAPLMGALSDRFGRRPVLLASIAATALALPAFVLVRDPAALVAWNVALGVAQAGTWPTASALLLDLVPPARRQTVLSLNYTAIALGYTVGVLPAGFLIALGYGALAAASAALLVVVLAVLALGLRGPLPDTRAPAGLPLRRALAHAPRDPAFMGLAALAFVFPLGLGLIVSTLAVYGADAGLTEPQVGFVLVVNGPLLAALAIPVNARLEGKGPYRMLPLAAAFLVLSYLLVAWQATVPVLAAATIVFTLGELIFSAALPAAVAGLAPAGLRGAYQGAWALVFSVASGSALFLSGLLRPHLGWPMTWLAWAGLTAAAGVALLLARPWFRRTADARQPS